MTTLTRSTKIRITNDWAAEFPSLAIYSPMRLLRRVGPLLTGIILERNSSNDNYLPIVHAHNLCYEFPDVSLAVREPLRKIRTGSTDLLRVVDHEKRYQEAVDRLKTQTALPFSGNLSISHIVHVYVNYLTTGACSHDLMYRDMISYAVWLGEQSLAQQLVQDGLSAALSRPQLYLNRSEGPEMRRDLEKLRSDWTELLSKRDKLRETCEEQVRALKAEHLPVSELVA